MLACASTATKKSVYQIVVVPWLARWMNFKSLVEVVRSGEANSLPQDLYKLSAYPKV